MKTTTEIAEIVRKLRVASDKYYENGTSELTDAEYDALVEQLRELDPDSPFFKEVGAPATGKLVKHEIPMGSLAKCKDDDELARWIGQVKDVAAKLKADATFTVQWKLDGSSLALNYKDGKLVSGVTRGDGIQGEDITENVRKMQNVKPEIPGFTGSLRGEMILKKSSFEKYFKPLGYKNPRNTVAGLARDQKGIDLQKHFEVIFYDVLTDQKEFATETDRISYMEELGLMVVEGYTPSLDQNEIKVIFSGITSKRDSLDYEIDGIVIRATDLKVQKEMGESSDMRPKSMRVLKFGAQGAITKFVDIIVTISHDGAMVPTAVLEPVEIGGVTVDSVLLNNYDYIKEKGIALGDLVYIFRRGDIIPWCGGVAEKAPNRKEVVPPEACIVCKSPLAKDGVHWRCTNEECEGVAVRKIKTWIKKREIKFIGDELISELFLRHNIKEAQDLYGLTYEYLSKVTRGNGVVGTAAKQIMAEIEKSKDCPLNEFLGSICIKFLGRRQAEILIDAGIDSLEKFLTVKVEDLQKIPGVGGGVKAKGIVEGIKKARPVIGALIEAGVKIQAVEKKAPVGTGKLSGRVICFTGVRPTAEEQAKYLVLGGVLKDGVSKALTHLVVMDPNTTSNKATKARTYGTQIIGYEEFKSWLQS